MKSISKTKKCHWCLKRKVIDKMYFITVKNKKEIYICSDCNLIHDIV